MDPNEVVDKFSAMFKKGYKTSEFWVALVTGGYLAGTQVFDPSKSLKEQAPAIVLAVLGSVYVFARTGLKTRRLDVLSVLASVATTVQTAVVDDTQDTEGDPTVPPGYVVLPADPVAASVTPTVPSNDPTSK